MKNSLVKKELRCLRSKTLSPDQAEALGLALTEGYSTIDKFVVAVSTVVSRIAMEIDRET